jgi:hypothetical protein
MDHNSIKYLISENHIDLDSELVDENNTESLSKPLIDRIE